MGRISASVEMDVDEGRWEEFQHLWRWTWMKADWEGFQHLCRWTWMKADWEEFQHLWRWTWMKADGKNFSICGDGRG